MLDIRIPHGRFKPVPKPELSVEPQYTNVCLRQVVLQEQDPLPPQVQIQPYLQRGWGRRWHVCCSILFNILQPLLEVLERQSVPLLLGPQRMEVSLSQNSLL